MDTKTATVLEWIFNGAIALVLIVTLCLASRAMRNFTVKQFKILSVFLVAFGAIGMITRRISGSRGSSPATEGTAALVLGGICVVAGLLIYYVKVYRAARKEGT